jgi:RsiW-degrading membrane proteinase PrsW (M82 family)
MPTGPVCCICGESVEPPLLRLGQRTYCQRHYQAVNRPHPGLWRATLLQIVGMALFAGLVAVLGNGLTGLTGWSLIAVGLLLALVPSGLWLLYFYRQDRLEPEPKTRIAQVLLLAVLLTEAVARPALLDWFQLPRYAALNNPAAIGGTILISGVIYQLIVYLAVRLVVYASDEFDERMDGIVYGTVAGLGVATLLNLRYILDNGGVALGPGVVQVVTTALAQASFGGLLGYLMAQAKFEHRPLWWVPGGFLLTALLNGLFSWLSSEVSSSGLSVEPWRSLLLALALALIIFLVLVLLIRRATTLELTGPARSVAGR